MAGPPLLDRFGSAGFADGSAATAGPPLPPMAARSHLELLRTVPDDVLDAMMEAAGVPDSPLGFAELRHWGGAMARPSPDTGPVGHRDVPFSVAALAPMTRALRRSASTATWIASSRGYGPTPPADPS